MDALLALSSELAGAVEQAARYVVGVNARRRFGSTGVHWRPGLVITADPTVEVDEERLLVCRVGELLGVLEQVEDCPRCAEVPLEEGDTCPVCGRTGPAAPRAIG